MTAVSILLPLDMIKVRTQISSEMGEHIRNPFIIASRLYNKEGGLRAFYRGIDSALLRQATFTSLRLGIFTNLGEFVKRYRNKKTLAVHEKAMCSLTAGGIAAFIDTPLDLSLVRMQADKTLPAELQRRYRNVIHALSSVIKEEGIVKLWKGAPPTVCRAMAANLAMLTTYEEAKERLIKKLGKQSYIPLLSGVIAGVTAATVSLPFDNIKTKIQKMKAPPGQPNPYRSVFDCLVKVSVVLSY
jgi:solute carrier family 25 oxoglutarate transporter 11